MESNDNIEFPIDNSIPITEKRCYTVEDLQIIQLPQRTCGGGVCSVKYR